MKDLSEQISKLMSSCNNQLSEDVVDFIESCDVSTDFSESAIAFLINAHIGTSEFNEPADAELENAIKKAKGFRDDDAIASIIDNGPKSQDIEIPKGKLTISFLTDILKKHSDYRVWKGSVYIKEPGNFHYIPLASSGALRTHILRLLCNGSDKNLRLLQKKISRSKATRVYNNILDDPFAQDAGKDFINSGNCILTSTGVCIVEDGKNTLVPFKKIKDRGLLFTYAVKAAFNRNAAHDAWDRFLSKFIGKNQQDHRRFWQLMGNLLFPNPAAKAIIIMHGNGNDGKSLLCKVIKMILTPFYAVCDADSTTAFSSFGIASFANAQIVFLHELNRTISQLSADIIKRLTGGDGVMINRKHKDIVDALLKLKLLITCNHLPRFAPGVIDQALINRLQFLKVKAPPKKLVDSELADKLFAERDYFITMAILGYAQLQSNNYKFDSSEKDTLLENAVLGINPAIAFRNDCCVIAEDGVLPGEDFKKVLKLWQKESLDDSKLKDIKQSLQNLGYEYKKMGTEPYRNKYCFTGLELNKEYKKAIMQAKEEVKINEKLD
jgi:phage/plasmid-associated DNA primase